MEIYVDGEYPEKYEPACVFCGNAADVEYKGRRVCKQCLEELSRVCVALGSVSAKDGERESRQVSP